MGEVAVPLYVMVLDEGEDKEKRRGSFRYTRSTLQSTLQLMGCKPRHAFKMSKLVFEMIKGESYTEDLLPNGIPLGCDASKGRTEKGNSTYTSDFIGKVEASNCFASEKDGDYRHLPFELYKRCTTVVVRRENFLDIVCNALSEYKYAGPNQRDNLNLACRIWERKESITILLCGTSGCGKSTLSALLGSRLGITTVISTDSIRHMMRSFVDENENPLLWASTYQAGEFLDLSAVAEAKIKRKAKKPAGVSYSPDDSAVDKSNGLLANHRQTEVVSPKEMVIEGFKAQSEMVIDSLDRLITAWEERKESVVIEGVHLSLNFVTDLMKKHPSVIPFMIYIADEEKHLERFAVRAKYMTLDPARNKYVKYIRNIRTIQEYLCKRADKHLIPKINNTNVDKSVAVIHATVFSCIRRRAAGECLYDHNRNTVAVVDEEYRNQCATNSLTSLGMLQLIQRNGSSRHLVGLLNTDGSVAKAWPLGTDNGIGYPMYRPLQIGNVEPVNLQFGQFGMSAWASDRGTSHAGNCDESRADGMDIGSSRNRSSCCSSPRLSEGPAKELKEEDNSVNGSDEDVDSPETDSDLSDDNKDRKDPEEVGSVDEESTKSDEEYDDLALQDVQEHGYRSDNDSKERRTTRSGALLTHASTDKYHKNLDRFRRARSELANPRYSLRSLLEEKDAHEVTIRSSLNLRGQAQSIPALGPQRSFLNDLIVSGAFQR